MPMNTNRDLLDAELEVTADTLAHGGAALCRTESGVVFVPGMLPGERAHIRITETRRSFSRGEVRELLETSPHRRPPACPAAAHGAGCCDLSYTTSTYGAALKTDILRDQLRRVGKLDTSLVDAVSTITLDPAPSAAAADSSPIPADQQALRHWRTVARWHVAPDGRIGTFAAGSHEVITAARCTQPAPELLEAIERIETARAAPPGSEVVLRLGPHGTISGQWRFGDQQANSSRGRQSARRRAQRGRARSARHPDWQSLPQELGIPPTGPAASLPEPHTTWILPASVFWQPHYGALAAYQRSVSALLAEVDGETLDSSTNQDRYEVWDLYSGVGALSAAPIAGRAASKQALRVHAVETAPAAVAAADVQNWGPRAAVQVHREPVGAWLERHLGAGTGRGSGRRVAVITDPPRAGLGGAVIQHLAALQPEHVLHIGCDIASFARDVGQLATVGFEVRTLTCVDAFPGTSHAEAVALLRWRG